MIPINCKIQRPPDDEQTTTKMNESEITARTSTKVEISMKQCTLFTAIILFVGFRDHKVY